VSSIFREDQLVLGGELKPGMRIAELSLVERLSASRTPIRMVLVRVQEEGLPESLANGGYAVKDFSESAGHGGPPSDVFIGSPQRQANLRLCVCVSRISGRGVVLGSAFRPD